jgi:hypothetical protein
MKLSHLPDTSVALLHLTTTAVAHVWHVPLAGISLLLLLLILHVLLAEKSGAAGSPQQQHCTTKHVPLAGNSVALLHMYRLQETQALLARLSQPSAAALHKEYHNCQRLTAFLCSDPLTTQFDQLTASQLSSTLLRWCTLAQPILQVVINQADHLTNYPAAFNAVGVLLNALGMCLESWVRQTEQQQQQLALKQQIAQQTTGEHMYRMTFTLKGLEV